MVNLRFLGSSLFLACAVLALVAGPTSADDKKDSVSPSGVWSRKGAEMKIEFADKEVLKLSPHGDKVNLVVLCKYEVTKEGRIKAKVTSLEASEELKEKVKGAVPVGLAFSFAWKVKDGTATLDDVKGDEVDALKGHLEGEFEEKK